MGKKQSDKVCWWQEFIPDSKDKGWWWVTAGWSYRNWVLNGRWSSIWINIRLKAKIIVFTILIRHLINHPNFSWKVIRSELTINPPQAQFWATKAGIINISSIFSSGQKEIRILGVSKKMNILLNAIFFPLYVSNILPHFEYCVKFCFTLLSKNKIKMEEVQRMETSMIKGIAKHP